MNLQTSFELSSILVKRGRLTIKVISESTGVLNAISEKISSLYSINPHAQKDKPDFLIVACLSSIELGKDIVSDSLEIHGEPQRIYDLDYRNRLISIRQPKYITWIVQHVLRLIRSLDRVINENFGRLYFHGAMIEINNKGIVICGEKRSGKTTTMLSFLNSGANFVCNDDVGIEPIGGIWHGYGSTRSISVRSDTLSLYHSLTKLATVANDISHPFNQGKSPSEQRYFYPTELADIFGVALCQQFNISAFLFPRFESEQQVPHLDKLDIESAEKALVANHVSAIDKYSECLRPFVDSNVSSRLKNLSELAKNIPSFKVKQSMHHSLDTPNCLLKALM